MSRSRLGNQKCILTLFTWKKTLDEGASVFGKTVKRTKHSAGSLTTVIALVTRNYVTNLSKNTSDPIQSNPIFYQEIGPNPTQSNPIQSMDESNPCPTLAEHRPDYFPVTQPIASKHWRRKVMCVFCVSVCLSVCLSVYVFCIWIHVVLFK